MSLVPTEGLTLYVFTISYKNLSAFLEFSLSTLLADQSSVRILESKARIHGSSVVK